MMSADVIGLFSLLGVFVITISSLLHYNTVPLVVAKVSWFICLIQVVFSRGHGVKFLPCMREKTTVQYRARGLFRGLSLGVAYV